MFNSNDMRKHGVIVNDVAKRDGGNQNMIVNGFTIPLDFVDNKTLSFYLQRPTLKDIQSMPIHWIWSDRQKRKCSKLIRRSPLTRDVVPSTWQQKLNSSEFITMKILDSTTQLCSSPVEMANRETPRQHRKSILAPLRPTRIERRVDSDTFFSSVKSTRKNKCVQIFYHLLSKFTFVNPMKKESHSHGAYLDFIREVGASDMILTDNVQTETGKNGQKTVENTLSNKGRQFPIINSRISLNVGFKHVKINACKTYEILGHHWKCVVTV